MKDKGDDQKLPEKQEVQEVQKVANKKLSEKGPFSRCPFKSFFLAGSTFGATSATVVLFTHHQFIGPTLFFDALEAFGVTNPTFGMEVGLAIGVSVLIALFLAAYFKYRCSKQFEPKDTSCLTLLTGGVF